MHQSLTSATILLFRVGTPLEEVMANVAGGAASPDSSGVLGGLAAPGAGCRGVAGWGAGWGEDGGGRGAASGMLGDAGPGVSDVGGSTTVGELAFTAGEAVVGSGG